MATPYDTFNLATALQQPQDALARYGNQRLAIEANRGARLGAVAEYKMQQDTIQARQDQREEHEARMVAIREQERNKSLQDAIRQEREIAYMVAYPETTDAELEALTDADLIRGINQHSNTRLRDSALVIDKAIKKETANVEQLLAMQTAADQREINSRIIKDPTFLEFIRNNVDAGWFGKSEKFAKDFATGKTTLNDLVEHAKDPVKLMDAYTTAVATASAGMTDKDGQPIIPPATLARVQQSISRINDLATLRQKNISQITDPAIQVEALGTTGSVDDIQGFRDDEIGGRLPPRPTDTGAATGVPTVAVPAVQPTPVFRTNPATGFPTPAVSSGPSAPSAPPMPSYLDRLSTTRDSSQNFAGFVPRETGVFRQPAQAPASPSFITAAPSAPPTPAPQSVGQQDPFMAHRQAALINQVLGTTDPELLTRANNLALSEGYDKATIERTLTDAFRGDPTATNTIRGYIQRAQSGSMMSPPGFAPAR